MNKISTTTLVGLAKILVVLAFMGAWVAKAITWQDAVTATLFAQGVLSGVGFIKSADSSDPKPPAV